VRTAIRFVLASSFLLVATPAFANDEEVAAPTATPAALPPLPTSPTPAPATAPIATAPIVIATPAPASAPIVDPLAEDRASPKEPPPDSARKAAIITAPIVYGIAATVAGVSYLEQSDHCHGNSSTRCTNARNWLIAYTAVSAIVPSTPRMVVGDWTGALLYSAARGGSIITAAAVNWGNENNWQGPFALGFAIPVALAVVDLATTPHRDAKAEKAEAQQQNARITSLAPVAVSDAGGRAKGAALSMGGTF
jgi:hypothetical protein